MPGLLRRFAAPLRGGVRAGAAVLCVLLAGLSGIAAQPGEFDRKLGEADALKSSDYPRFAAILTDVDAAKAELAPAQLQYLNYLKAWERGYAGDYEQAIPLYKAVISQSDDAVLQFRATASLVSNLTIARRYQEAYTYLDMLVERLPQTSNPQAREQGLHAAALLNIQAGQYDLGLDFSNRLLQERKGLRGECIARELRVESLYKSNRLDPEGEDVALALETCNSHGELVFANIVRGYQAKARIDNGRYRDAITLLDASYEELQRTRYLRMVSEFDVLLASAHFNLGDLAKARAYALRSVDKRVPNEVTEPLVAAYQLLYRIAQQQGDTKAALAYYEKYAEADKQHLDDVSARALAYQMARHQAIATKLQIEALNKQNQVLQLQQQLAGKAAETSRLYIALLIAGLLMLFLWAFHTKRRQLHFRHLSQHDGLTGISNRPHFIDVARRTLDDCRRSVRECSLILLDLDHFKTINDLHGHAAGDQVLKQVVAACSTYLRPNQLFGRIGGEEFAILLADCSAVRAMALAEQLRQAVAATSVGSGLPGVNISCSFGVVSSVTAGYELRQLLASADAALYQAKRDGRNQVVLYQGKQGALGAALP